MLRHLLRKLHRALHFRRSPFGYQHSFSIATPGSTCPVAAAAKPTTRPRPRTAEPTAPGCTNYLLRPWSDLLQPASTSVRKYGVRSRSASMLMRQTKAANTNAYYFIQHCISCFALRVLRSLSHIMQLPSSPSLHCSLSVLQPAGETCGQHTATAVPPCGRHLPASQPLGLLVASADGCGLLIRPTSVRAAFRLCRPSSLRFFVGAAAASLSLRSGWRGGWWRTAKPPAAKNLRYCKQAYPSFCCLQFACQSVHNSAVNYSCRSSAP